MSDNPTDAEKYIFQQLGGIDPAEGIIKWANIQDCVAEFSRSTAIPLHNIQFKMTEVSEHATAKDACCFGEFGAELFAAILSYFSICTYHEGNPLDHVNKLIPGIPLDKQDKTMFVNEQNFKDAIHHDTVTIDNASPKPENEKIRLSLDGCTALNISGFQKDGPINDEIRFPKRVQGNNTATENGYAVESLVGISSNIAAIGTHLAPHYVESTKGEKTIVVRCGNQPPVNHRKFTTSRPFFEPHIPHSKEKSGILITSVGGNELEMHVRPFVIYPYKLDHYPDAKYPVIYADYLGEGGINLNPPKKDHVIADSSVTTTGISKDIVLDRKAACGIMPEDMKVLHRILFGTDFDDYFVWEDDGLNPAHRATIMYSVIMSKFNREYNGLSNIGDWIKLYARLHNCMSNTGKWMFPRFPRDRPELAFQVYSMYNRAHPFRHGFVEGCGRGQGALGGAFLKFPGVTWKELSESRYQSIDLVRHGIQHSFGTAGRTAPFKTVCVHGYYQDTTCTNYGVDDSGKHFFTKRLTNTLNGYSMFLQEQSQGGEATSTLDILKGYVESLVADPTAPHLLGELRDEKHPLAKNNPFWPDIFNPDIFTTLPTELKGLFNLKHLKRPGAIRDCTNHHLQFCIHFVNYIRNSPSNSTPRIMYKKEMEGLFQKKLENAEVHLIFPPDEEGQPNVTLSCDLTRAILTPGLKPPLQLHCMFVKRCTPKGSIQKMIETTGSNLAGVMYAIVSPLYGLGDESPSYHEYARKNVTDLLTMLESPQIIDFPPDSTITYFNGTTEISKETNIRFKVSLAITWQSIPHEIQFCIPGLPEQIFTNFHDG